MRYALHVLAVSACASSMTTAQVDFSPDFGTTGAPGSAVNASPNVGEVFSADGVSNILVGDLASLGLVPGDNIDALTRGDIRGSISGVLEYPFLFSVEPGAVGERPYPVWAQAPTNAADVYAINQNVTGHVLAYDESVLGLSSVIDESIDAVTDPRIRDGVRIYFSLQQGSPTLLSNAWSGADVLTVVVGAPASLRRAIRARDMGLIPEDEVDGLTMYGRMDANGNAVFDDPADYAAVYFSVDELSVGEIGTEVRQRYQTSAYHGGDIYRTALFGNHQLHYEADGLIRLGQRDILDALKQGSLDQRTRSRCTERVARTPTTSRASPETAHPTAGSACPSGASGSRSATRRCPIW